MVMTAEQRLQYEIDRRKKKGMAAPKFQAKLNKLQAGNPAVPPQAQVPTEPGLPPVVNVPGVDGTIGVTQSTQQGLANAGLNEAWNPQLTSLPMSGDLQTERSRIEDQVFGRLTKNLDSNRARDKQELEQSLYNRGIGVGNPLYNQQMQEFNQRYDDLTTDARQRAAEVGGQELDRTFGMGWSQRQNELGEQGTIRGTNMSNVKDINQMSLDTFSTLFGIKDAQQAKDLQRYIADLQAKTSIKTANIGANASKAIAAMRNSGGGGGGGGDGISFP